MAAKNEDMHMLHSKLAKLFIERIDADASEDGMPLDAATLSAIRTFLKDNNITSDPASSADLTGLRDRLAAANAERAARLRVIRGAKEDIETGT